MTLIASTVHLSRARPSHGVELRSLDELIAESDFRHHSRVKTPETIGMLGRDLLAKAKPGLRSSTSAARHRRRGGSRRGHPRRIVQGAGLDVFTKEPTTESPLFELSSVVVSPHLGASTAEAQDKAGDHRRAVLLALAGDFVPYAVNVRRVTCPRRAAVHGLARAMGRFFSGLHDGAPDRLEIEFQGELASATPESLRCPP